MKPTFSIEVDKQIYDDAVISKAIYWHTTDFVIDRTTNENLELITFRAKKNELSEVEKDNVIQKFNQDLNDFKLRQIVNQETKDIRTVLYIKAFANNDNFVEYE